jgi:hypothetical protein
MADHKFEVGSTVAANLLSNASLTLERWPSGEVAEGDNVTLERPGYILKATVVEVVGPAVSHKFLWLDILAYL